MGTPVPIPNTEVKPTSADGTWEETPWESRTPPDFSYEKDPLGGPFLVPGQFLRILTPTSGSLPGF